MHIIYAKLTNLFMLSVRISSCGCTREVWRERKMRKSSSAPLSVLGLLSFTNLSAGRTALSLVSIKTANIY